jgi:hypothetical protein
MCRLIEIVAWVSLGIGIGVVAILIVLYAGGVI